MNEHSHIAFLQDLAVVMIAAGLAALLFHKLRQPVVLGYILAGLIIGPHTPPFPLVQNQQSIETLAELGMILLMFSLGLHFSLRTLRKVGTTALAAGVLEILLMLWVGYEVGRLFKWSPMNSLFLGAILCISSTTIIVKALEDLGKSREAFAQIIFGILIVEDLLAIALIALLSSIALTGTLEAGQVLVTLGRIGVFLSVALVLGLIAVPPLLRNVAKYRSNEMLLVTALALCFGVALLAVKLGFSVALGAFVIGTIIGEAREIGKIKLLTEPVRDMFSAVFFVAVGMLIEPRLLAEYWVPVAVITVAVIVGKVLTCSFGTFIAGHDTHTSMRVGMGLAQIGEFSFIIAALGLKLKVTGDFLYPIAVTVSAITTLLTPYLIKSADPLVDLFSRAAPKPFVAYLELYSRWVERLRLSRRDSPGRRLAYKWLWQMALNVALVTAVFLAAAYVAPWLARQWPGLPVWFGGTPGLVWLGAVLLALPSIIAVFRKLQAFAMLIAEMSAGVAPQQRESMTATQVIISRTIFMAGITALGVWVLAVSAPFLPPWPAMVLLLCVIGVVTALCWRFFVQIHAKAQLALRESLSEPPPPSHEPEVSETPILKGAEIEMVTVAESSPAAGKLIGELELRSRTGASVVGIERTEATVVNPGPDEELMAGDRVLLLGTRKQLDRARSLLMK